jgi:hypothetical protein
MKPKKEAFQPFANLQWTRVPGSEDYFDRADFLRDRFGKLAAVILLMALIAPIMAVWVIRRARAPNPVQVVADGRVFSGPLSYTTHVDSDTISKQLCDTVEVLLTRTEQGGVKALDDFVGEGVTALVDADFAASKKMISGYSQTFSITSSRVLISSPRWIVLGVRGLLSSRTMTGYQPSELFFVAGFAPGQKTDRNMLGWRLVRLIPDPEGQMYFKPELARERAARLGIGQ